MLCHIYFMEWTNDGAIKKSWLQKWKKKDGLKKLKTSGGFSQLTAALQTSGKTDRP